MKKTILLVVITFTTIFGAQAQTFLKTNSLYWIALLPNIQVETKLADNFTFQGEVNMSFWQNIKYSPQVIGQFIAGSRWYSATAFDGFYVGIDAAFDLFQVSKPNYWATNSSEVHKEQRGYGIYFGATLGYQLRIARRLMLDFYAGGGWHLGFYQGFSVFADGSERMYIDWNKSGEWLPYKLGVAISYRIQRF